MRSPSRFGAPPVGYESRRVGLIDEYRLYLCPFVLGRGKPYFARARPPVRILSSDGIGEDAVLVTCVPI